MRQLRCQLDRIDFEIEVRCICWVIQKSYYCQADGYSLNSEIEYGSLGTEGTLSSGDAFDCDVNGDGEISIFDINEAIKYKDQDKENDCYKEAADVAKDGKIDIFDYNEIIKLKRKE